jgi:UrcA family protein
MRTKLVAVSAAAALVCGVAAAQSLPEVKVEATRVIASPITAKAVGKTASGIPIKDITLSYGVTSEGLDLSTHTGALAFEQRVKDAAEQACQEIGRQYPDATPGDAECAKTAANAAMTQVHAAVAASEKIRTATK